MRMYEDLPEEISHPAHAAHKLQILSTGGAPFMCDGCMEPGDGPRYTCCRFNLHTCCALAEETFVHPLFGDALKFRFLPSPLPPVEHTVCDACGEPARGFVYHCRERDLDLHPCCATLQKNITIYGHTFELRGEGPRRCAVCGENGRRRRFWAYRSRYDGKCIYLHVACVKEIARRSWEEACHSRVGGGGCILQASVPIMEGVLQNLPSKTSSSSRFHKFVKIVGTVVKIIVAVIFGDPMALIAAVAGPGGLLRG